jgi:hypothetical protein
MSRAESELDKEVPLEGRAMVVGGAGAAPEGVTRGDARVGGAGPGVEGGRQEGCGPGSMTEKSMGLLNGTRGVAGAGLDLSGGEEEEEEEEVRAGGACAWSRGGDDTRRHAWLSEAYTHCLCMHIVVHSSS